MAIVRVAAKVLLYFAVAVAGLFVVLSLPAGLGYLLFFVLQETWLAFLVPALGVFVVGCGSVAAFHWFRRGDGKSGAFSLPPALWLAVGAALAIAGGLARLMSGRLLLFWPGFILAAALPPLAALALAGQRLPGATTWRRVLAGFTFGSLLSVHATILLTVGVSGLAYLLIMPLRDFVAQALAYPSLERLFYSPALMVALIGMAVVAPVVEEFAKPLGAFLLAKRLRGPAEAFLVGMAGGAGFAVLENMLYESASPDYWAHISTLRAIGGALHPVNAGLVAVGWYGVRGGLPGAWGRLGGLYALAVGTHSLWNGALVVLTSGIGGYFFGKEPWQVDIYGIGAPGVVLLFMLLEAIALWRLLYVVTGRLAGSAKPAEEPFVGLQLERPARLAIWATAVALVALPVAALYGPALARYLELVVSFR